MSPIETLHEGREIRIRAMRGGHIRGGIFAGGRPQQTEHMVFTSSDRLRLEPLVPVVGGEIERYEPQGAGEEPWRLRSETDALTCLFPFATFEENVRQDYELWGRGGLKRRCTGRTASLLDVDGETGEISETEQDCICEAQGKLECAAGTRVFLLIPQAGLVIWELRTTSKIAAVDLYDQCRFVASVARDRMNHVPVRLGYFVREISYFDADKRKRLKTKKRLWHVSVAGDAERALSPLGVSPDRALLAAVKEVLGRPALGQGDAPALDAGVEASSPETTLAYGEGVSGSEGEETSGEPEAEDPGLGAAPVPSGDEPASAKAWENAATHGVKAATALKIARKLWPDAGIRSAADLTGDQLSKVLAAHLDGIR